MIIKSKKNIVYYLVFFFLLIGIFFYKNELNNWLEGDIENIYLIYNVIITSNSIVPSHVDYPGNSSFIIYSFFLKLISFFDGLVILNLNDLINNSRPELILNRIFVYLKLIQLFYTFLIASIIFVILNFVTENKVCSCLLSSIFILSPPFIENLTRLRIDLDSILFFLISIFFLILSLRKKKINNFFLFFSGFFLCASLFSKTAIIFLTLSIPIIPLFVYKKYLNLKNIFQELKYNQFYFLFLAFNFFQFIVFILLKNNFSFIVIFTNNVFYFTFYIFFSLLFRLINVRNINFCLIIFSTGFIFSIILMYLIALDLNKIYFVLNPISTFLNQISVSDSKNFLLFLSSYFNNSMNIKINYLDIVLLFFFSYLFFKNKKKIIINLLLISLFIIYKIIFISKYSLYYDIYPLFLLIFLIASNLKLNNRYLTIILSIIFITSLFINRNYLLNNSFNKIVKNDSVCLFKKLNKKEFKSLEPQENFLLYYAPKFAIHEFVQKLCEKKQ